VVPPSRFDISPTYITCPACGRRSRVSRLSKLAVIFAGLLAGGAALFATDIAGLGLHGWETLALLFPVIVVVGALTGRATMRLVPE